MKTSLALLKINFHEGRPSPIDLIVIHVTEGNAAAVRSWFNNPEAEVSAHYMVTKLGEVVQFVQDDDTAWHAGRIDHPTAALVIARGTNPNSYSIGIEHEGNGKEELTDAQRGASVELIAGICERYNIPIDRRHIVGHHEIFRPKTCPGAISVDRLVADVKASTTRPDPPRVVWSPYLRDWLVATRVVDDTHWYYQRVTMMAKTGTLATVPLSQMEVAP